MSCSSDMEVIQAAEDIKFSWPGGKTAAGTFEGGRRVGGVCGYGRVVVVEAGTIYF